MPIIPHFNTRRLAQDEFGAMAYEVMRHVFDMHRELGRFFDEKIYKRELTHRLPNVVLELPIDVTFESFIKRSLLDVLVAEGAPFEFKAVDSLAPRHRAQLLNYLLLADLAHGKLVNIRPETVEHEFVNTTFRHPDRHAFGINVSRWNDALPGAKPFCEQLIPLLRDWGAGLELALYEEALTQFCGGETRVAQEVEVLVAGHSLGHQRMRLATPTTAFRLTALERNLEGFGAHARRLPAHANLSAIFWLNITVNEIAFTTLQS